MMFQTSPRAPVGATPSESYVGACNNIREKPIDALMNRTMDGYPQKGRRILIGADFHCGVGT